MSAARVPVSNGARAHWRKWVFALSFVVGPAIGIVLAGLFFLVVACVDQSLSCGADDFLLGTLLFGIYGAPAGLLNGPSRLNVVCMPNCRRIPATRAVAP